MSYHLTHFVIVIVIKVYSVRGRWDERYVTLKHCKRRMVAGIAVQVHSLTMLS